MIYGTFLQSLPLWYLISRRRKISFLVFHCFRDLRKIKKLGDFYSVNIFAREAGGALESHERSHDVQTRPGGAAHPQTTPPRPVWLSSVASALSFWNYFRLGRKSTPYFPGIFWGGGGGGTLLPPLEEADPAVLLLSPVGNRHHHHHRLLLGMGRRIFVAIFTIPNINTIYTSRSNVIPLIVYGRLNPGYCLTIVCMFLLGILSLFCGKVKLSDCVVIHTPLIMIMYDTRE
jgi:hypothetical protein